MPTDLPVSIGHYKILKKLGRSNFSTVYLAQLEAAEQTEPVALKVLDASARVDQEFLKQLQREVRLAAKLKHPHIIGIYNTNNSQKNPFIAMEYVAGGTLRERLKNNPLSRAEAISIIKQIGAALSHAHSHQLIHGGVKPGNILLDTSQNPVRSVLTDFGMKELLSPWLKKGDSPGDSSPIPEASGYMAPEQWELQSPLTPAADVYGLAVTLFEMLVGRRSFEAGVLSKLTQKWRHNPLPLLSQVAYKVGPFFDQVLTRATAQDPADRYQRVADFIEAVKIVNEEVEQAEQLIQQRRATQAVKMAQSYLTKNNYNLERALVLTDEVLGIYPGHAEAQRLRGEIRLKQERFAEALEDYRQVYEQEPDPSSAAGLDYLNALKQVAETFWQRQADRETFKHYKVIKQVVDEKGAEAVSARAWQEAWARLVESHHQAGAEAYTSGDVAYAANNIESMAQAQHILKREIRALESLQAGDESRDLQDKLRLLQVKKYQNIVRVEEAAIAASHAQNSSAPYSNEAIFQHYFNLAEAYQKLIELEPHHGPWLEQKEKVEQERKYYEVQKFIAAGDYLQALPHLVENFINTGYYEYRDVTKLLWGLVYAKQNEGKFPPEWESVSVREEVEEVAPKANDHQQNLEKLIKSPYLVLSVQVLIIITSVVIGIMLQIIIRDLLF